MYDTMIIGRDLSSLIAGLTSVRQGMKTVLVTERDPDEVYCEDGYTFSADTLPLAGLGDSQAAFNLINGLRLFPEESTPFLLASPGFQVILPGHRLDIFNVREQLIGEMIREFPEQEGEIRRFYRAVEKVGSLIDYWIRKDGLLLLEGFGSFFRWMSRLPALIAGYRSLICRRGSDNRAFLSVVEAELAVLSHLDAGSQPLSLAAAYLLSLPWRGIFYPVGGRNALMRLLYKSFEDGGGILVKNCAVIRIDTNSNIIADLENAGVPFNLRSRRLIISTQWEKINLMLLEQRALRKLKLRLKSVQCTGYPFSLHMGIREGGIPERMTPYIAVIQDESRPILERNLVFLETSLAGETERAPMGRRALTATAFLSVSPLMMSDDDLQQVARDILVSLEGFLPFLRENIDYIHVERSIDFSRNFQEMVNLKYRTGKRILLGTNTLSPKTPLPHVFLTGGMLRAGMGCEGEILSGIHAALLAGCEVQNHG
jgi:phytoene dehydrogenase-like protein